MSSPAPRRRYGALCPPKWILVTILCYCLLNTAPQQQYGVLAFVSNPNSIVTSTSSSSSSSIASKTRTAFRPTSKQQPQGTVQQQQNHQQRRHQTHQPSPTQLNFMGSDGGVLGIGTPELFTILLVGYFVLGPSDLYKLVKEIGKFVQNLRTFTTEATASIENNLESQLQLEEIRKAQRELTDAFSFRRSINVDEDTEAFEVNAQSPRVMDMAMTETDAVTTTAAAAAAVTATATENGEATSDALQPKKKIRRRRVKKQPAPTLVEGEDFTTPSPLGLNRLGEGDLAYDIPDLSVEDTWFSESQEAADKALREANEELRREAMEAEADERRKERIQRLQSSIGSQESISDQQTETATARFASQLSGNWNGQILEKEDELMPLANIMERLALLEEEKQAADERLQEEFRLREENEERFYREKRKLLEEAAAQVQANVYNLD